MCMNVSNGEAKNVDFMVASLTGHLVHRVNEFRNEAKDSKASALEMVGRRLVAGLSYAALSVAALVEMVARIAIGLLLVIPCALLACCVDGDAIYLPLIFGGFGLFFGPDVAIRCLSAFVQNCYRERIAYDELPPFGTCMNW